jgi:hypothetical protein
MEKNIPTSKLSSSTFMEKHKQAFFFSFVILLVILTGYLIITTEAPLYGKIIQLLTLPLMLLYSGRAIYIEPRFKISSLIALIIAEYFILGSIQVIVNFFSVSIVDIVSP